MINKKRIKTIGIFLGGVVLAGAFTQISKANFLEPGSQEDPLVTLSYIEKNNTQLKQYIDEKLAQIQSSGGATQNPQQTGFVAIQLTKNQKLIGGEGTEIILRSGEATAIGNAHGDGLSNITKAKDLKMGEKVDQNHLLIVPRNDGRGIMAKTDIWVMVKGSYSIQ